jgi:ABC-type glycerol-3-phosphate transport system substrate-binding protein
MRRYTATATIAAALLLALTACGNEKSGPATTVAATATANVKITSTPTPTPDPEEVLEDCVDAVAERASDTEGQVPSEPKPEECTHMDDSDYAEAYMKGIHQNNLDVLEDRQRDRDEVDPDDEP